MTNSSSLKTLVHSSLRKHSNLLARAALVVGATWLGGCLFCTQIGCEDDVRITLPTTLTSGTHRIVVTDVAGKATFKVCELDFSSPTTNSSTCPAIINTLSSGNGTSVRDLAFSFEGPPPKEVSVTFTSDGNPAATTNHQLQFSVDRPNGDHCAPTCHNASITL